MSRGEELLILLHWEGSRQLRNLNLKWPLAPFRVTDRENQAVWEISVRQLPMGHQTDPSQAGDT